MAFKSVLKPENSIIAGLAVIGLVYGTYQLAVGPVSQVHQTPAHTDANTVSIRKAGYTALVEVAGIALLARDPNIVILGGAAIIAFHAHYRHADMVDPGTGQITAPPGRSSYTPAENLVPMQRQAPTA